MQITLHRTMVPWVLGIALAIGLVALAALPVVFASDGSYAHHGTGELALDEDENLIIPAKEDAALCEALQP